jgi:hypothetical protein
VRAFATWGAAAASVTWGLPTGLGRARDAADPVTERVDFARGRTDAALEVRAAPAADGAPCAVDADRAAPVLAPGRAFEPAARLVDAVRAADAARAAEVWGLTGRFLAAGESAAAEVRLERAGHDFFGSRITGSMTADPLRSAAAVRGRRGARMERALSGSLVERSAGVSRSLSFDGRLAGSGVLDLGYS